MAELGQLNPGQAKEIADLCDATGHTDPPPVRSHGIGAPLLLDALLRTSGADRVLREIGRRERGASLEPELRLLVGGRIFGATSIAQTAREQRLLSPPPDTSSPISYDLLLRALTALGEGRSTLEAWLTEASGSSQTIRIAIDAGFCRAHSACSSPLIAEVAAPDLLPVSLHTRERLPGGLDIVATGSDGSGADDARATDLTEDRRFVDLGHTRTILGRTLLERAERSEPCPLQCGGDARLAAGPDGHRYALVRPGATSSDAGASIHRRIRSAERLLAQLRRDVRAKKVRRAATITARARRVIADANAWRWLEFDAADGRFTYNRRVERVRRDLNHAGEHIVRICGDEQNALDDLDATVTIAVLFGQDLSVLPVRHRSPRRVEGHLALCLLAGWLLRILNRRLHTDGSQIGFRDALKLARDAKAWSFDLSASRIVGRPPIGNDLSATLTAAGVSDPRSEVHALVSRISPTD